MNMKLRYRLFLPRKTVYYAFDDHQDTHKPQDLDKVEANRLLMAVNEAGKQPAMNLSLARIYLSAIISYQHEASFRLTTLSGLCLASHRGQHRAATPRHPCQCRRTLS